MNKLACHAPCRNQEHRGCKCWQANPTTSCCRCRRRYENLVQVRCLLEGVPAEDILADWHGLLAHYMAKWGLERAEVRGSSVARAAAAAFAVKFARFEGRH